jgi:hypothetical protein
MSEEEDDAEPIVQEEVYVPIFLELCYLTTKIINLFTGGNVNLTCEDSIVIKNMYFDITKQVIADKRILNLDKYDINDSTKQIITSWWKSYPPIFYVKLSNLMQNLSVVRQNNYRMNDSKRQTIAELVRNLNEYYKIQKDNTPTYLVSSTETSGYYVDEAPVTTEVKKEDYIAKYWRDNIWTKIKEFQSGGNPSRKRKPKKTKRRKNTQKKNTKKRSRK